MQPGLTAYRANHIMEELDKKIFGHPSDDRPMRMLLNFCDHMPRALTKGPLEWMIFNVN
jgi:hypothetical protein